MIRALLVSCAFLGGFAGGAAAQSCGISYQVRAGDSLSVIAERQYDDAFLWTDLYAANREIIGPDPDRILVGSSLALPCFADETAEETLADAPGDATQDPVSDVVPPSPLVVAQTGALPPFVDVRRAGGGMITEVIRESVGAGFPGRETIFANPAVAAPELVSDLIYPVMHPECLPGNTSSRCADFLYSDPLFEMLMLFFVPNDAPVALISDDDLRGRRICRPAGQPVHMLNTGGKNWLAENVVSIVRAADADGCFALLDDAGVDAVMLNEFTGRAAVAAAGRERNILALDKSPVGIVTLHAAVPRSAPDAAQVITDFNAGLREIRATGRFQAILERHMAAVWAGL